MKVKSIGVVLVLVCLATSAFAAELFTFTRVYVDEKDVSHFTEVELPMNNIKPAPDMPTVSGSAPIDAEGVQFFCFPARTKVDWHTLSSPRFYFILSGGVQLETSDGQTRRFGPGSVILGEVTSGKGVRAEYADGYETCIVVAPLSAEAAAAIDTATE